MPEYNHIISDVKDELSEIAKEYPPNMGGFLDFVSDLGLAEIFEETHGQEMIYNGEEF